MLAAGQERLRHLLGMLIQKNPAVRISPEPAVDKPELVVRKERGQWEVTVNPGAELRVEVVEAGTSEQRRVARFWARNIRQREEVMVRVAEGIMVGRQRQFLAHGPGKVAPCTTSEVGKDVGLHQATVSRAAMGRRIQTPHGIFELRHFFGPALKTVTGGQTSAQAVREHLKQLLKSEGPACSWSDEDLRELLEKRYGVVMRRRTVAKYRKQMGVPVALERKSCDGPRRIG